MSASTQVSVFYTLHFSLPVVDQRSCHYKTISLIICLIFSSELILLTIALILEGRLEIPISG